MVDCCCCCPCLSSGRSSSSHRHRHFFSITSLRKNGSHHRCCCHIIAVTAALSPSRCCHRFFAIVLQPLSSSLSPSCHRCLHCVIAFAFASSPQLLSTIASSLLPSRCHCYCRLRIITTLTVTSSLFVVAVVTFASPLSPLHCCFCLHDAVVAFALPQLLSTIASSLLPLRCRCHCHLRIITALTVVSSLLPLSPSRRHCHLCIAVVAFATPLFPFQFHCCLCDAIVAFASLLTPSSCRCCLCVVVVADVGSRAIVGRTTAMSLSATNLLSAVV